MRGLSLSFKNTFPMRAQWTPEMIPYACGRLVAWYDMTDSSTIWEDAAGSDPAEDGDRIQKIDNKAYDGLGASSTSLNTAILQTSLTSSFQPVWTAPNGNAAGYLTYSGTESLTSSTTVGNVSAGKMGGVTLNHENFTVSFVMLNSSTTETNDHYYFGWNDSSRAASVLSLEAADDQMHWEPNGGSAGVDSGTAFSGAVESWTIVGGIHVAPGNCDDGRFIRIFRNGVQVGSTNTTDWTSYARDLTANSANVIFDFGHWSGDTDRFVGRIFEYIQTDRAITEEELEQLNTYYGVKYNIS